MTPRAKWVDLTLWLKGGQTHPRLRKVDDYGVLGRILHFRLTDERDVDPKLLKLLREAYQVGAQDTRAPGAGRANSRRGA